MTEHSRFFRIPPAQIALARALVEGYEGVASLHSQGPNRGEVELVIPSTCSEEAEELIEAVRRETGWVEIPRPSDWDEPQRIAPGLEPDLS